MEWCVMESKTIPIFFTLFLLGNCRGTVGLEEEVCPISKSGNEDALGAKQWMESFGKVEKCSGIAPPCFLSETGPYPYLLRIVNASRTFGHGSLVTEDKVLSTCSPFKDLSKGLLGTWVLIGYNFGERCQQRRKPYRIDMHESCRVKHPSTNGPISHDFALWTVEAFDMEGLPFLWGNGMPHPAPVHTLEKAMDSLLKRQKSLSVGLFRHLDSDGPELRSHVRVNYIDWFVCLDMIQKLTNITGDLIHRLDNITTSIEGFHDYFCGYEEGSEPKDGGNSGNPFYSDWYSGAAVIYEGHSGKVPIGMFSRQISVGAQMSNSENVKSFRIITGFHRGLYEFLKENRIEPGRNPKGTPSFGLEDTEENTEEKTHTYQTSVYSPNFSSSTRQSLALINDMDREAENSDQANRQSRPTVFTCIQSLAIIGMINNYY